jgi:hypothetical protein
MAGPVLVAWVVQAVAGVLLLTRARRRGGTVAVHACVSVVALGLWTAFVATDRVGWGWAAFGTLTVGNGVGDALLVRRSRRALGPGASGRADYGAAIRGVFAGRFPRLVTFHALFAGIVYFGSLAACVAATLQA